MLPAVAARVSIGRLCFLDWLSLGPDVVVQAKLLCAQKISHAKSLLKFIRTEAAPPLLWQPAALNDELETLYVVPSPLSS